jgi:hypothetical protein
VRNSVYLALDGITQRKRDQQTNSDCVRQSEQKPVDARLRGSRFGLILRPLIRIGVTASNS